jgi:hypothetical protein
MVGDSLAYPHDDWCEICKSIARGKISHPFCKGSLLRNPYAGVTVDMNMIALGAVSNQTDNHYPGQMELDLQGPELQV